VSAHCAAACRPGVIDARCQCDRGRSFRQAQKLKDESDAALKAYETELASARFAGPGNWQTKTREKLNATCGRPNAKTLEDQLNAKLAGRRKADRGGPARTAMGNVRGIAAGCGQRPSSSASPARCPTATR